MRRIIACWKHEISLVLRYQFNSLVITQLHLYQPVTLFSFFGFLLNCLCNPHLLLFFVLQFAHQLLVLFFVFSEFVFLLLMLSLHHRLILTDCWCRNGSCITTLLGLGRRFFFLGSGIFIAQFLNIIDCLSSFSWQLGIKCAIQQAV